MPPSLELQASQLPKSPGVYLFKDQRERILYVGKAVDLRARVRQYLSGNDTRTMVPYLVNSARIIDGIVTETEKEALLLENTLIKKHRPRFNIRLRDDATYMHLRLDLKGKWPRYRVARRVKPDGALYFGPYSSAQKARQTLTFLQRIFPLRTCTDHTLKTRTRPCILHQMGRCVAPCVDLVTPEAYHQIAKDSTLLLDGQAKRVMNALKAKMFAAAEAEAFEEAARLRDLIAAIQATTERQLVVDPGGDDLDVWALHREGKFIAVARIPVREGIMGEPIIQVKDSVVGDDEEVLSQALNDFYAPGAQIPSLVLLPIPTEQMSALAELLSERRGRRVRLMHPKRGPKAKLASLATKNARQRLEQRTDESARRLSTLDHLAKVAHLPAAPRRIECFDNSHIAGQSPVAAMAVFTDGQADRSEYRRYRIKTALGGDDYGGMREILTRRFKRALDDGQFPDLLLVDGGKGQVSAAMAVLTDLGIEDQPVLGIVKPRTAHKKGDRRATDRLVHPSFKDPITLPKSDPALRMLQALRDETHNAAVRYQRKVRQKKTLTSALQALPGVGPARRKTLIKTLGSIQDVIAADIETLAGVPGIGPKLAEQIWHTLHGSASSS